MLSQISLMLQLTRILFFWIKVQPLKKISTKIVVYLKRNAKELQNKAKELKKGREDTIKRKCG